jgi:predicted ribosomally synthesized peptide with SipW-like signal peptide
MKTRKGLRRTTPAALLGSLAAVTMAVVAGVAGTTAALSDVTGNEDNKFNAGQIELEDNDTSQFMYQVDDAMPGDTVSKCIQVSYTGNMDSDVSLYMTTPIDAVGPYVDLVIEAGTQTSPVFPDCAGFTADETLFTGTLADFQTNTASAATGIVYSPNGVGAPWTDADAVIYRVTLTLQNVVRPAGANFSGAHTYSWRADTV